MKEYHKIPVIFRRDEKTKKFIEGEYLSETIKFLKDVLWIFTEKIDGTNIRIYWDGHTISFGGRTDRAQIPQPLYSKLESIFGGNVIEELFEQTFGEKEVILFGEGYGPKIQNGGEYRDDVSFILFDVMISDNYQPRNSVEEIASLFNIDVVPVVLIGTIEEAINYIKQHPKSLVAKNGAFMEGVVGRTYIETQDRTGKRNIVKIKYCDFQN